MTRSLRDEDEQSEAQFNRARNLLYLQKSGVKLARVSEDWLIEYIKNCTPGKLELMEHLMDKLGIGK